MRTFSTPFSSNWVAACRASSLPVIRIPVKASAPVSTSRPSGSYCLIGSLASLYHFEMAPHNRLPWLGKTRYLQNPIGVSTTHHKD
jgi:hypothetical protein